METTIYLSLSQTSTYSLNSTQSTQVKPGDYTHSLLESHMKNTESRGDEKYKQMEERHPDTQG